VLDGAPEAEGPDDATVLRAVERHLAGGSTLRDAAAEAAAEVGVHRRRAYELALRAKEDGMPGPGAGLEQTRGAAARTSTHSLEEGT
jgi:hypothetical protein